MSFLRTTAALRHETPLPPGTDRADAVRRLLHDHAFLIGCGPHSVDCARMAAEEEAQLAAARLAEGGVEPDVQEVLEAAAAAAAAAAGQESPGRDAPPYRAYRVTDVVHTLPAGLWDSRVVSTYELASVARGVQVRIRSPMAVVMDTTWTVEGADGGGLVLVERVLISCSRVLLGTVRGLCESGWPAIHEKMVGGLGGDN